MKHEIIQGASQEPFLAAWTLGFTARRRRIWLKPINRWKIVPFLMLGRLALPSNESSIRLGNGVRLPWLSPRWLETTRTTIVKAESPTERNFRENALNVGATPRGRLPGAHIGAPLQSLNQSALILHEESEPSPAATAAEIQSQSASAPPLVASIALQWARRGSSTAKQERTSVLMRVISPFVTLNRHAWGPLMELVPTGAARGDRLFSFFSAAGTSSNKTSAFGWTEQPASRREAEADAIRPELVTIQPGQSGEDETERKPSSRRAEFGPGFAAHSVTPAMPYPTAPVGMRRPFRGGEEVFPQAGYVDSKTHSAGVHRVSSDLQPMLGQQSALPALALIAEAVRNTVKHEMAASMKHEEEKRTTAPLRTDNEPLSHAAETISDEMGRAVMQKLRSMAEEERFRSGKLR